MMPNPRVTNWMKEIRVIDGGFGSECARRSSRKIDGHPAWSCILLKEDPNLVCDVHKSFIKAGCDVISTNTYQASPTTLAAALGISRTEAIELMRHAVRLARRAVESVEEESNNSEPCAKLNRKLPLLIAGSLGPYGACQADGSEYTGTYIDHIEFSDLVEFHRSRAQVLYEAGVDLLAWETIPSAAEVGAICEAMRALPDDAVGWLSVASQDGQTTVYGDPLYKVSLELNNCDQLFGIGVNCCIPHAKIGQALTNLNTIHETSESSGNEDGFHPPPRSRLPYRLTEVSKKIFIVYPNSGEQWIQSPGKSNRRTSACGHWIWPVGTGPSCWAKEIIKWATRRQDTTVDRGTGSSLNESSTQRSADNLTPQAQWIGGCCRVTPSQIRQLAEKIKPDEFILPAGEKKEETVQDMPLSGQPSPSSVMERTDPVIAGSATQSGSHRSHTQTRDNKRVRERKVITPKRKRRC